MDFTLTRFLSLIVMRCSFLDSIYPSFLPPSLSSSINRMRELLSYLETVSTDLRREFPDRWIVDAKLVAFAADQILCKLQNLLLRKDAAMASSTSGKKRKLQETGSSSFSCFATEGFYTSFPSSSQIDDDINWIISILEELLVSGEIKIGYSGVLAYIINPGLSELEVGELLYSRNPSQPWFEKYKTLMKQSVLIVGPESVNSFFNPIYNHQPRQASVFTWITSLHLSGLSDFVELPGLTVLHTLKISGCERLNEVSICEKLLEVKVLEISYCPELTSLAGLNQLLSLRSLSLSFCFNLQFDLDVQLPPLLEYLDLTHCTSLEEWCQNAGLQNWKRSFPVGDSPVYGREKEKNSIIDFLLSDDLNRNNLTVVCMVGESGVGKTSMVHLIYNEERVLDSFDAHIFITMPEKSDETTLIKKLIESVMSFPCPMTEADLLEELLMDELSDTKVFVVLDDAENENPCFWNRIVTILNQSSRGSALLVSTKSKDVAEVIGAMQIYYLDPLSDYYCWKIFCQHIFTGLSTNANTDVVETGKQLISKCQRNPLCIKVLAGLLVCSKNEESLFEILKTDLGDIFGFDGDTLPILRVGYELLPDNLKKCLHYCSLFPKDYVFAKQQIVRMWMSQGFIIPVEGRQPEEVGLHNFDELLLRGFFQHSPLHDVEEDKYIMHNLIRALATHLSRNECSPAEDAVEMILENCFHFSLNPSKIQIDKMKPLIKEASDLQSFLALSKLQTRINISFMDITSLSDLFTKCINLRTLDLNCTDIVELPSSVGMLKQLGYLGVNNTKIRSIPRALCNLLSLQTLEAKDCQHLVELPESMMELTNLRHLDMSKKSGCVKMMTGIGQLTNLQSLAVFCVGCEMPYCSIRELKNLNRLSSCLQIAGLENIRNGLDAKEAALHNKVHLNTLCLHWKDNRTCIDSEESVTISEEVLNNLKPNPQIGELIIRNYRGNLFPTWMGDPSFSKLVSVILDKCLNCSQFPALGGLPSLRHLSVQKLYHLERLEIADRQFGSKNTPKFPSLETLNLWEMYDLEELFETSDRDFSCLRTLSINRCPLLKRIPCFSSLLSLSLICCVKLPYIPDLPSLKLLRIDGFRKLKSLELPKYLPALKKLEIRHCNELLLVEGLPELSLEKLNVVCCPKFGSPKGWKLYHQEPISTTRWFFPKEESTTQMEHEETSEPSGEDRNDEQPKVDKSDFFLKSSVEGGGMRGKCFGQQGCLTWGAAATSGRMVEMNDAHVLAPEFLSISCGDAGGCLASVVSEGGKVCEVELRFFGVYDGHSGSQVAQYCVSRMHEAVKEEWENNEESLSWQKRWEVAFQRGIQRVDDELISNCVAPHNVGSTAVVAVVSGCQIICANCGDSRAVLCQRGQPLPLTIDHKPDRADELVRIESTGGRVIYWDGARVLGILTKTRAVGIRYLRPYVIANPEVTFHTRSEDDDCLILGSDGLWNVVSNEVACDVAYRILRKSKRKSGLVADGTQIPAQAIADYLLKLAFARGSSDNISIVVVDLKVRNKPLLEFPVTATVPNSNCKRRKGPC